MALRCDGTNGQYFSLYSFFVPVWRVFCAILSTIRRELKMYLVPILLFLLQVLASCNPKDYFKVGLLRRLDFCRRLRSRLPSIRDGQGAFSRRLWADFGAFTFRAIQPVRRSGRAVPHPLYFRCFRPAQIRGGLAVI